MKDLSKWRDSMYRDREIPILLSKMSLLFNLTCGLNAISTKI
jgi:hypothetical protein